ncbi:484_t:CDS:1, partial [Cetraspora pellucida]
IAIAGASPMNTFIEKLVWMLRCLGCPFIGVFYSVNIGGKEEPRCLFWLPVEYFDTKEGIKPPYRPVGFYTMKPKANKDITERINRCTAKASVLEKFSSIISMYYIVVGVLAGISRTTGSQICEDWPYIPLLLSWTLPALCRRIFYGNLVVKDPKIEFKNITITMEETPDIRRHKRVTVTLIAFISIVLPWLTLFLAYFTPPIGYYCRSKYVTTICAIWSFNSILAYFWHLKGEKDLTNPSILH